MPVGRSQRKSLQRQICILAEWQHIRLLWPSSRDEPTKRGVRRFAVSVANPTFRIGRPVCIGPTFCRASLLRMSTSNFWMCHILHDRICVACGQVFAEDALPLLCTCFMNHACSICSAVHLLPPQTCSDQAPAPHEQATPPIASPTGHSSSRPSCSI
jgi:hypothetical protein